MGIYESEEFCCKSEEGVGVVAREEYVGHALPYN